jgi:diaminopimelate decarboxylase
MVISREPVALAQPFEADRDTLSPNRNLTPLTTALDGEGRLTVAGCVLSDLANQPLIATFPVGRVVC